MRIAAVAGTFGGVVAVMLAYRDFAPRSLSRSMWEELTGAETYETFDVAVEAANAWIRSQRVKVVNVETVVFPNVFEKSEEGTSDARVTTMSGWASWHQFVRVWYET